MWDLFDIDSDGKLSFEEKLLALTVVMGILDEEEQVDDFSDGFDEGFDDDNADDGF